MQIEPGSSYTLDEIAAYVRAQLDQQGLTMRDVAGQIAKVEERSVRSIEAQLSMALKNPNKRPGTIYQLVEAVTPFRLLDQPLYVVEPNSE